MRSGGRRGIRVVVLVVVRVQYVGAVRGLGLARRAGGRAFSDLDGKTAAVRTEESRKNRKSIRDGEIVISPEILREMIELSSREVCEKGTKRFSNPKGPNLKGPEAALHGCRRAPFTASLSAAQAS